VDTAERNARINALARKKRAEGLTEEELQEQQSLRLAYLREFRQGMEQMLESIVVEQPDGSVAPLRKRSSS
jgi:uncharacterized protein YnzC (UPF0291/DUF896 family)